MIVTINDNQASTDMLQKAVILISIKPSGLPFLRMKQLRQRGICHGIASETVGYLYY